jgi:hypothetical protein
LKYTIWYQISEFSYETMTCNLHYLDTGLFKQPGLLEEQINIVWSMYKSSLFYCISSISLGKTNSLYNTVQCGKTVKEYRWQRFIKAWRGEETLLLAPQNNSYTLFMSHAALGIF